MAAPTGIAATLLVKGMTLHKLFDLPLDCDENATSRISQESKQAQVCCREARCLGGPCAGGSAREPTLMYAGRWDKPENVWITRISPQRINNMCLNHQHSGRGRQEWTERHARPEGNLGAAGPDETEWLGSQEQDASSTPATQISF